MSASPVVSVLRSAVIALAAVTTAVAVAACSGGGKPAPAAMTMRAAGAAGLITARLIIACLWRASLVG